MAQQQTRISQLLPPQAPLAEVARQAEVYIADLERMGYADQAAEYTNAFRSNLQAGGSAKSYEEAQVIAGNLYGMLGGLQNLSKASLAEKKEFTTLTDEQEAELFGKPSPGVFQLGSTGELKEVSPRTYASPEEVVKQNQLEAQYKILNERRAKAESASDILPQVNRMVELLNQNLKTGRFQSLVLPFKQFATDLGIEAPDVTGQEQFEALSGNVALGYVEKTRGSISNAEMQFFTKVISPSIGLDEETNRQLLMFLREAAKKEDRIADAILEGQEKGDNPYQIQRRIRAIKNDNSILKAFGVSEDGQVAEETRPSFNLDEQKRILEEEEARLRE